MAADDVSLPLLLEVWSLSAPVSGAAAPGATGGLFYTAFGIENYQDLTTNSYPLVMVKTARLPLADPPNLQPLDLGLETHRPNGDDGYSVSVWDIVAFKFHTDSGWPHLINLSGSTFPLRASTVDIYNPYGPFCLDRSSDPVNPTVYNVNAFWRLLGASAWPGSFVRLFSANRTLNTNQGTKWWLIFNFPFRTPLMGDDKGLLSPNKGGVLDNRLPLAVYKGEGSVSSQVLFPDPENIAEIRSAGLARRPYFAGALMGPQGPEHPTSLQNVLQGVAINAPAFASLAGMEFNGQSPSLPKAVSDDDKRRLDQLNRLATSTQLADGLWWVKNHVQDEGPDDNRGDYIDNTDELTIGFESLQPLLDGALSGGDVVNKPPRVTLPAAPLLTALTSISPCDGPTGETFAPEIPLLSLFGLRTAATTAPSTTSVLSAANTTEPYHYLHTRLVPGAEGGALTFEWRRWIGLESDPVRRGSAVPAMVRVRQKPFDPAAPATARYTVSLEGLTDSQILGVWSKLAAGPSREAAARATGAQTPSFVPDILGDGKVDDGLWVLELDCSETFLGPIQLGASQCQPPLTPETFVNGGCMYKAAASPLTLAKTTPWGWFTSSPPERAPADAMGPDHGLSATAAMLVFHGVNDELGQPLEVQVGQTLFAKPSDPGPADPLAELRFNFLGGRASFDGHRVIIQKPQPGAVSSPSQQVVAFGGLDFVIRSDTAMVDTVTVQIDPDPASVTVWTYAESGRAVEVAEVRVGGSDDPSRPVSSQPLVWSGSQGPHDAQPRPIGQGLGWRIYDRPTSVSGRRQVDISLVQQSAQAGGTGDNSPAALRVVTLDPKPMAVVASTSTAVLAGAAAQEVVATWDSQAQLWRLPTSSGPTAVLELPPQGLGEAWERRKQAPGQSDYLPCDQISEGERAPALLTPTAAITIQTEARARNPVAWWNLQRLLADLSVDLPGSQLISINALEALYGLETFETGTSGLRIAEQTAWRGAPRDVPSLPSADVQQTDRQNRWTRARETLTNRLGVFEARNANDPLARVVIPNVKFKLRKGGKYVLPTNDQVPGGWFLADDATNEGVLGGALGGFEDGGLIQNLLADALGGVGTIEGFQLSALGAWTKPRAGFNGGLTQISAEIEMGRTHEARFERLGRIGIFRTKAKHVIVYRRSFLPSLQFSADQDPHHGRPIVRKAEEFIEILQPYRGFPDVIGGDAKHTGPIIGHRFHTIRIAVHGSWRYPLKDAAGEEIGYAIPLWREGADPVIYPRPHIEALTAAHPDAEELEPAGQRIFNVGDLVFYTLFDHGSFKADLDTDNWPNIMGVDLADRALDSPLSTINQERMPGAAQFRSGGDAAVKLPLATAIAGGLEGFTLQLEPGAGANLTFGRSAKAMMAVLETVTLMRAKAVPPPPPPPAPQPPPTKRWQALQHSDQIEAAREATRDELAGLVARASQNPTGAALTALKADAQGFIDGRVADLKSRFLAAGTIQNPTCGWPSDLAEKVTVAAKLANDQLNAWIADINRAETNWALYGAAVKSDLDATQSFLASLVTPSQAARTLAYQTVSNVAGRLDVYQSQIEADLDGGASSLSNLLDQALSIIDPTTIANSVIGALTNAAPTVGASPVNLALVNEAAASLRNLARQLRNASALVNSAGGRAEATLQAAANELAHVSDDLAASLIGKVTPIRAIMLEACRLLDAAAASMNGLAADIEAGQRAVRAASSAAVSTAEAALTQAIKSAIAQLIATGHGYADAALVAAQTGLAAAKTTIGNAVAELKTTLTTEANAAGNAAANVIPPQVDGDFSTAVAAVRSSITALEKELQTVEKNAKEPAASFLEDLKAKLNALTTLLGLTKYAQDVTTIEKTACDYVNNIAGKLGDSVQSWIKYLTDATNTPSLTPAQLTNLKNVIANGAAVDLAAALKPVAQAIEASTAKYAGYVRTVADVAQDAAAAFADDSVLRLVRAAGAPPLVEGLAFNRDRLAYFFDDVQKIVTTPVTALLEQAGEELRGVGVVLPTLGLDDTLLAPVADSLGPAVQDVTDSLTLTADEILSDLAGFKELLSGLDLKSALGGAVKISHDVDLKTRSAFVQADIDHSFSDYPMFEYDAFALTVQDAHLTGAIRYDRSLAGAETKRVNAEMSATWVLELGGTPLISIKDAKAQYNDQSGLKFDIKPQNIQFNGALEAISNVLAAYDGVDSPINIEMVTEGGLPVGVRSSYDLPPTIMGFGAFTLMNATLGVALELAQRSEFEIRVSAYMGRKASPFSMVIVWLGGGGYFEASAIYLPSTKAIDLAVDVSIGATAGIGFSFGPLEGFVEVYFGIEATYVSQSGGGQLMVAGLIVIDGAVTAWGIVTVTLGVQLSLTYSGGNHAVGRGQIDVEVQISRFFHLGFSSQITRTI